MADPVLIASDNRLLGWALTDLTLYGGQPAPDVVIGRAGLEGGEVAPPPGAPAQGGTAARPGEAELAAGETTALLDRTVSEPGAQSVAPSPLIQIPVVEPTIGAEPPSVPQPVGAGSFVQSTVATPLQTVEANASAQTSIAPNAPVSVDAVTPAQIATTAAPATQALDPATALAGQAAARVADLSLPVLEASATAQDASAAIGDTVDTLAMTADALPATVLAATNATTAALDTAPIESFGGTDPAAGLTTLVGLVESSEAFDIVDSTAPAPEALQPSILDSLAADEAPSPLLGDSPPGDNPLDGGGPDLGL